MARRRIVEGTWRCSSCEADGILGRHKTCPQCGNPREGAETRFDFGGDAAATVHDPELLALASAGEDWFCRRCTASNRGDVPACVQCGAERGAEPEPDATPPRTTKRAHSGVPRRWLTAWGLALTAPLWVAVLCCAGVGWRAVRDRVLEVDAAVVARTWIREVRVERLVAAPDEGWQDALPLEATPPGPGVGPDELHEGLGELGACEVRRCWPRPPRGATLARVTGRSWSHEITTRRLVATEHDGWDDEVPSSRASLPVAGAGGSEGVDGSPDCRSREREPERCRDEHRQEQCGTDERCRTRDLGNGFAEEVCEDVPRYCTRTERVCTPAVHDDWCTWTERSWTAGRRVVRTGTLDAPAWPALSPAADEQVSRQAQYTVAVAPLAGGRQDTFHPDSAEALLGFAPDALVFVQGDRADRVPAALVPPDAAGRVDCGDGIPQGVLTTRQWCRFERWSWRAEAPLTASSSDGPPAWPEGGLGADGREVRREWLTVDFEWTRGDHRGRHTIERPAEQWEVWPLGRVVPVRVDARAALVGFPEGSPLGP